MRKIFLIPAIVGMAISLAACGEKVEVPPAHVGKILTKNGYKPDTVPPSKFRLDPCWAYCDKIVLVEAADEGFKETFSLFMPKDQLNMAFDVRMTLSVKTEAEHLDSIFSRITPKTTNVDGEQVVTTEQIYFTYGQPIVRDVVRSVAAEFSINEIASSRNAINSQIVSAVRKALENTPISVKTLALADVQFPEVITKQKEAAATRRIQIEEQEAKKQIAIVELSTELEKAKARRAIERENAEAIREANAIYAESVTEKWLEYKRLQVMEELAKNPNTVFVPFEALSTVGMSNRVFSRENK